MSDEENEFRNMLEAGGFGIAFDLRPPEDDSIMWTCFKCSLNEGTDWLVSPDNVEAHTHTHLMEFE